MTSAAVWRRSAGLVKSSRHSILGLTEAASWSAHQSGLCASVAHPIRFVKLKMCIRQRLLPVQQHVAGAVDLGGEVIGAAVIGVELLHQAAVRRPDRLGIGAGHEAEDLVCLLDR